MTNTKAKYDLDLEPELSQVKKRVAMQKLFDKFKPIMDELLDTSLEGDLFPKNTEDFNNAKIALAMFLEQRNKHGKFRTCPVVIGRIKVQQADHGIEISMILSSVKTYPQIGRAVIWNEYGKRN